MQRRVCFLLCQAHWRSYKGWGISVSEANEIIKNPSTRRFADNANSGNVNYFLDAGGKIIRITTDPAGQRIISAGIVQARNIANGIASGRFTK